MSELSYPWARCAERGLSVSQTAWFILGRPSSFAAALQTARSSWTALLDVMRLGPVDDATAVTATQLRGVVERLIAAGQWSRGSR